MLTIASRDRLKQSKFHLENEVKDNEEKLKRINARLERQQQQQQAAT